MRFATDDDHAIIEAAWERLKTDQAIPGPPVFGDSDDPDDHLTKEEARAVWHTFGRVIETAQSIDPTFWKITSLRMQLERERRRCWVCGRYNDPRCATEC